VIPITRPFLPPRAEFEALLDEVWERRWLTNNGPLVHRLETALGASIGAPHLRCVSSGTMALQLAVRALALDGEVVTTPFSYVATTSALVWEGCTPVFADIEANTLTIDPASVDAAITPRTSAIVATHVFGSPCDVDALEAIGRARGLPVVYDAAQAFGTTVGGRSVLTFGDVSTCSFHATKVFHTIEGGAVISPDEQIVEAVERLRNFGHVGYTTFDGLGINAKVSEVHAAMGLCVLTHLDRLLARRREIADRYRAGLAGLVDEGRVRPQHHRSGATVNHAYVPYLFEDHARREKVHAALVAHDVHPRRYFSPGLNELDYVKPVALEVADDVAARVLCLPTYHDLTDAEVERVVAVVVGAHRR